MAQQTITALYDTREFANDALRMLQQAGVSDVTISPEGAGTGEVGVAEPHAKGFWSSLEGMFGGTDDHATYAEGVRRGGVLLTAHVDDGKVDDAVHIVERHGSVDLNERETAWRGEGWTGSTAVTGGGIANEGAGPLRSLTPVAQPRNDMAAARAIDAGPVMTAVSPAVPAAKAPVAARGDVLQVVEESLQVGKRAVNRGKVRIHSYVVETPVTQTVSLRDETVTVDRRPVDRALGVGELGVDAFKDRTIEMEEIDEEAVVAKTTRVVEEIGIRKDVKDEVRTITDTVRSTKVDIDDARVSGARTGLMAGFTAEIAKDMEVVGSDGRHVGLVDHVDGSTIKLKKNDPASGGSHHLIPTDWVKSVDAKVMLKTVAEDVKSRWTAA